MSLMCVNKEAELRKKTFICETDVFQILVCDVNIYTSSSNNKQCNGNRSKFTRLPCLSEEGLHAVTRGRAALRTERISGTLDRIYIRTLGYRQRYIYFLG